MCNPINDPSAARVAEVAAQLGIHLTREEADAYSEVARRELDQLRQFVAIASESRAVRTGGPQRDPGRAPTDEEDPYHAWTWKCDIRPERQGLLSGVTISVKDHISVAGIPQSLASPPLDNFVPDVDATVVARARQAGARIVGKNVMNGFMDASRPPTNPHATDHVAGGSSSGSSVAVAAGEVDIAFGGDQGGSIRIPSAYCGVVGLKPTFGLVSHYGANFGFEQSLDHIGPIARRVEHVATALQAVAGYDELDPRQGRSVPPSIDVLSSLGDGVHGITIGVLEEGFDDPIEPGVREAVMAAIRVLAKLGAVVTTVSVPEHRTLNGPYMALALEGSKALYATAPFGMWAQTQYPIATTAAIAKMWREDANMFPHRARLNNVVAELSRIEFDGTAYYHAHNARPAYVRAYDRALEAGAILAMPTVRNVAPRRSAPNEAPSALVSELEQRNWILNPTTYNTKPMNFTGHPALAVPCGKVHGLPVSMQLVAAHFGEERLLRVAHAFQQAVDWDALTACGDG